MENYYTTQEVCEILNCTKYTVYRYTQKGLLHPLPAHPQYPGRKHKLFKQHEVEELKNSISLNGYSVKETADIMGVSTRTVLNYIYQGKIRAQDQEYLGHKRYSIPIQEIERINKVYKY